MNLLGRLWRSTVGQKALAALSGLGLVVWVALHLVGNLTAFGGAQAMDRYGAALHGLPGLLWLVRAGLLGAAVLHVVVVSRLVARAYRARPGRPRLVQVLLRGSGVLLAGFVVFHLLHLTTGALHPGFAPGRPYHNLVTGLGPPLLAGLYLAAAALLGLHLHQGLASGLRSLGLTPGRAPRLLAVGLAAGFASLPLAVLLGVLR